MLCFENGSFRAFAISMVKAHQDSLRPVSTFTEGSRAGTLRFDCGSKMQKLVTWLEVVQQMK